MSAFVIRSMSTSDYVPAGYGRPEQKPVPYHVYLKPAGKRAGAWWTRSPIESARYETEAEAIAERDRLFADAFTKPQVVPADADALGLPPFWHRAA